MGLTASNSGGGNFTPAPSGTHIARCCWLIDLGLQEREYKGEVKRQQKCLIGWEIPHELVPDGERKGEPFFLSSFYTISLSEKSKLRPHLEAWRGRPFTKDELAAFDLRNILDTPCLISVVHDKKDNGDVRALVSSVSALMKGQECPPRVNPLRLYDADKPDPEVYDALPEWVQSWIDRAIQPAERYEAPSDPESPPPVGDELEEPPF